MCKPKSRRSKKKGLVMASPPPPAPSAHPHPDDSDIDPVLAYIDAAFALDSSAARKPLPLFGPANRVHIDDEETPRS